MAKTFKIAAARHSQGGGGSNYLDILIPFSLLLLAFLLRP